MDKWAFIYTIGSATTRVDVIGTLVCVGVPHVEDAGMLLAASHVSASV
jgi:hypothetical protein